MSGNTVGAIVGGGVGFLIGGPVGAKWGFMAGQLLGAILLPDHIKSPRLTDANRQTSQEGVPIPFGYARFPCSGNLIWTAKVKEHSHKEGGKGGPSQTSYTYTRSYAVGVCKGEAEFQIVKRNGKVVYDVTPGSTMLADNSKFLQKCKLYTGTSTQMPDPTIEEHEGVGEVAPHRDMAYIVLTDDETNSGEAAQWEFVMQTCGTVTNLTLPAEPILIHGANEYAGTPTSLSTLSGTAPSLVETANATSLDGLVLAVELLSNDLGIYRWDGTSYVAQTITGGTPGTGVFAIEGLVVSDDGTLVFVAAFDLDAILVYQFDGVDTYAKVETESFANPLALCLSPNRSQLVVTGTSGGIGYLVIFDVNNSTGALSSYLSSAGYVSPSGYVDWVAGKILTSAAYSLRIFDASDLSADAIQYASDSKAWFSSDGLYVYQGNSVFDGSTLALINTYSYAGTGGGNHTISKDRKYLFIAHDTTANSLFALTGATMTLVSNSIAVIPVANGAVFTGLAAPLSWYAIPDAPGAYVDEDGLVNTDYVVGTSLSSCDAILGDIVADLCRQAGLLDTEFDVSELTDFVAGYRCATQSSALAFIEPLMQAFFFDRGEWDKKVRFIKRGGAATFALTIDDMTVQNGPAIRQTIAQEVELARKVNVMTLDPAASYNMTKQTWERRASTIVALSEPTFEIPVVMSTDNAAHVAEIMGKIAWSESIKFKFGHTLKYSKITCTDVGTLTDRRGVVHRIRIQSQAESDLRFAVEEGVRDRAEIYTGTIAGNIGNAPTPGGVSGLIGPTFFAAMDLPRVRSQDDTDGFYIGACGMLPGWPGCQIIMSVDGGLSYKVMLTITVATKLGKLIVAAGVSGEPLSVRMFSGQLESKTLAQVGLGANWSAIQTSDVAEIVSYQTQVESPVNYYALTNVVRALEGTVAATHAVGDIFMDLNTAYFLPISPEYSGITLLFKAVAFGISADAVDPVAVPFTASTRVYDGGLIT